MTTAIHILAVLFFGYIIYSVVKAWDESAIYFTDDEPAVEEDESINTTKETK